MFSLTSLSSNGSRDSGNNPRPKRRGGLPKWCAHRKFIFSQMVAAFSMLRSWLGVSRKAPLVRKSFSLISESVSPWSCQSAEPRRPSWFKRNIELLLDVDMPFSHCVLPLCSGCDIFYSVASEPRTGDLTYAAREGMVLYVCNDVTRDRSLERMSARNRTYVVLHCFVSRSTTVLLYAPPNRRDERMARRGR